MSLTPVPAFGADAPRRTGATQAHQAFAYGAPIRGIDVTQPLPGGDPFTAVRMDNLIPRVLGCQLRRGYARWVSNLGGEVRTILQFHPAGAPPEMFSASSNGDIYDTTLATPSGVTPVPVLSAPGDRSGDWSTINFTTGTEEHTMISVCPGAGMYVYNAGVWNLIAQGTAAGEIEGVDPATFSFVTVFKNRLWFTVKESTTAWYLPTGQYAGKATPFPFGGMLPHGGAVVGLANWSFDGGGASGGGAGLTNQLVIIADQGDVLVYTGNDPDTADDFKVVGRWYIGRVPTGHRFFSQFGTDVAILSERGVAFITELMRGQGFFKNAETTRAINSEIAKQVAGTLTEYSWEVKFLPHEQLLVILMPVMFGETRQWAYEVNNKAFCGLNFMPMLTAETFDGRSFFGDRNGNLWWAFEGNTDGAVDGVPGTDLVATVVTAFQPLGESIRTKTFQMVRASFISAAPPGVSLVLNSEWDLQTPTNAPAYLAGGESQWNTAQWNEAEWSASGDSYESWQGAEGSGRYGALSMQLRAAADTIWVSWQAVVLPGGIY
jgi:hypothetical protein